MCSLTSTPMSDVRCPAKHLLSVIKEVVTLMCGEKEAKKLNSLSLSNDTVKRRIQEMSHDVLVQVLERVKESPFFAIQLDESTDI